MKRCIALLLLLALLGSLTACKQENTPASTQAADPTPTAKTVDVCLPAEGDTWSLYADTLTSHLTAQGHEVRVHFAQNDSGEQARQVKTAVSEQSDCVVLVPVDAMAITGALTEAVGAGVKILTLDRQTTHSQGLHGAVTFDYTLIGKTIAGHIVEAKQLKTAKEEKRSYTIEFLMGSTDDHSALLLHQGVMEVLQPFLDNGVLDCKTGRTSFEDTYVQRWDSILAKEKCLGYLNSYKKEPLDILCVASDSIARGCIDALTEKKYTPETWPVITGFGGDTEALQAVAEGQQTATVSMDRTAMLERCSELVHLLLTDAPMPPSDAPTDSDRDAPLYFCPVTPVYGPEAAKALLPQTATPPVTTAPAQ